MRSTAVLAVSFWISTALALPAVFTQETCVCEPVEQTYQPISPPLSCVRTAAEISNWRALSFHRPELADKFVDMSGLGASKTSSQTSLAASGTRGIRKPGHCIVNRIKLALKALKHGNLSPRAVRSSFGRENRLSRSSSPLDTLHLRTPHRLSVSSSQNVDNQFNRPARASSAFSDDKSRHWKVVCYAQERDLPHNFQATVLAFTPFMFIIAFIASLRVQADEDVEDEKK